MPEAVKTVGRYEILRELGRGGMATVHLARQTDLDRLVALKELGSFHAADPAFAQRFVRESRMAGSLGHPNIVTVHDFFEHGGTFSRHPTPLVFDSIQRQCPRLVFEPHCARRLADCRRRATAETPGQLHVTDGTNDVE